MASCCIMFDTSCVHMGSVCQYRNDIIELRILDNKGLIGRSKS